MLGLQVISIKDEEFYELTDIIRNYCGIIFRKNKQYLLEYKLTPRLRELNFNSFSDYIYYLKYPSPNKHEIQRLINLVTINETYFFREKNQIEYMIRNAIPELIKKGKKNFKIWSAACSTGEEPYSIAILLKESSLLSRYNFEITATDIDTEVLEKAKLGVYKKTSFRNINDEKLLMKYFEIQNQNYYLKNEIKSVVKIMYLNLMENGIIKYLGKMDFIFCRNVLIYFDVEMKKRVAELFYKILNDDGYLFLGYAETLSRVTDKFILTNFTEGSFYKKRL
jgi:chemotaxis protein methyltransferase CheR